VSANVSSFSADQEKARALMHSKSTTEMLKRLHAAEELAWTESLCRSQLESKSLPTKCYEYLNHQKKTKSHQSLHQLEQMLDRYCEEGAHDIQSLKDVRLKALTKSHVSSFCRNQILGIKKRLIYQAFDSDRASLFFRTH
ncbi:MAG: hypothetical protein AB7F59_15605, partial [Bdellovibrionales bacterium]